MFLYIVNSNHINLGKYYPLTYPPFNVLLTSFSNTLISFIIYWAASLLRGSLGLGSINKNKTPDIILYKFKTGFQSALRIFKQTFPYKSIFGWYIFVSQCTFGGLCG